VLVKLLQCGDITGSNQHGFKKNHSTVTALLQIQNEIAYSLDNNYYHGILSLDLSAAFDMVNPGLLVTRMKHAGLPNDVIDLIKDWLSNREAYVEIGGESSTLFKVPEGTVQGSVLGPILFAIFIAPMFKLARVSSFADDSYLSENGSDVRDVVNKLQNSASLLTKWLKSSGMIVNESKTEFVIFHRTRKELYELKINDITIKSKHTMKALGVTLDQNLNWEQHISNVSKQCSISNMGFRVLRKYFNQQELLQLATSLYYSKMYYAAEVWLQPKLTVKLQRSLLSSSAKILKTITGAKCNEEDRISFYEIHKRTRRATPNMMLHYLQATCLHRIMSTQTPETIYEDLLSSHVEPRRHYKPNFIKSNKTIVGENIFKNRIQKTCSQISKDMTVLSYNALKILAKKDFLNFS